MGIKTPPTVSHDVLGYTIPTALCFEELDQLRESPLPCCSDKTPLTFSDDVPVHARLFGLIINFLQYLAVLFCVVFVLRCTTTFLYNATALFVEIFWCTLYYTFHVLCSIFNTAQSLAN